MNLRTSQNDDPLPKKIVDKLPTSDAILIVLFGICLPSWDVYSDVAFIVNLFMNDHPNFASMMFGPLTASILFTIPHWWRSEGTWFRRLITLPLLLGLCWPQYRAVRILVLGLCLKVSSWRKEKETIDKDVSSIGTIFIIEFCRICTLRSIYVLILYFTEPFVEAVPQVMLLIMLQFYHIDHGGKETELLFFVTFVTSVLTAGFGLTKFLKLGPCRLLGGYGKISFPLAMLNIILVLVTKGFCIIVSKGTFIWLCTCFMPGFIFVRTILISVQL